MPYANPEDRRANGRRDYHAHPDKYKARDKIRKRKVREWYRSLKAGSCVRCGESHPACLDFHHIGEKLFNISSTYYRVSKKEILAEIAKCELLCANCHRKEHFVDREGLI